MRESTVLEEGSRMSMRRLWVRISNSSRESLSLCGERMTQYRLRSVGDGAGHAGAGLLGGVHDELGGLINDLVVVALEANPDLLA